MNSAFLRRPGAVAAADGPDTAVPAHYGSPLREQRALAEGRAVVDLSHLGVVEVRGDDRLSWLTSLTTQDVRDLAPGDSAEVLLLTPQGRIQSAFAMLDDGERSLLITDTGRAGELAEFLHSMRFLLRVEVRECSDELFTVGTLGQLHLEGKHLDGPVWRDPWREGTTTGVTYATATEHPASRWIFSLHLLDAAQHASLASSETEAAGVDALAALRIAAWRPRPAREFDDRALPHEFDLLRSAVHLSKGCYRGQETVAKVHNLGHPPRRLARLDFDGALPAPGTLVYAPGADKPVGKVTTAAHHYEEGPIALALLKRAAPTGDLVADGVAAAQTVIVPPEAGSTVDLSAFRGR